MLARLQQGLTLALLALALAWALAAGSFAYALLGWLLAFAAYAAVIGLEFLLMHHVNRDDPAPRASAAQLWRAWMGEVLSGPRVFGWRQPWRSRAWPDAPHAPGQRGVLFVHGFVCNRGLWAPWCRRLQARGTPWVAVNLEPVFGRIDEYLPIIEAAVRQLEQATGEPPVVVAHSMGGLALRRWWAEPGNAARLRHAITIGSPHHGTWLARWAMSPNGVQMQRGSAWLHELAARETTLPAGRMTCFYGHCDNIVFPASTAMLEGADNRHLPAVAHVHMADHPAAFEALRQQL